jgi:hypothetical protein
MSAAGLMPAGDSNTPTVAPASPACGDDFVAAAELALRSGDFSRISDAEIQRVMTAAVRLYAAKADATGETPVPVTPELVTPTDIVVTVSELIRAAGLNLWDLSMWFARKR